MMLVEGFDPLVTFDVRAANVPGPVPALLLGAPSNSIDKPVTEAGVLYVTRHVTQGVPPVVVPKF